jgi:hypothetical protein
MSSVTAAKDGADWSVFALQTSGGRAVVVRSRLGNPDVQAFAAANLLARVRCTLPPAQVNEAGMPLDTEALDAFEDELVAQFEQAEAATQPIVVVTGDGSRDLYFSASDGARQLVESLKAIHCERAFEIKPMRIDDSKPQLLKAFTPGMAPHRS